MWVCVCARACLCVWFVREGFPRSKMRALGIGSPLLIMSCACLLFVEERGAAWICGSAAHFGCMCRGPLLSCLMTTHAIVGSTFPSVCAWRARLPPLLASRACADVYGAVGGRVVWLVDWGGLMRCCLTYTLTPKPSSHASLATTDWAARC